MTTENKQIQLEAGKFYRTKDGLKVGPMEWSYAAIGFPFYGRSSDGILGFKNDGTSYRGFNFDIVSLWSEPDQPGEGWRYVEVGEARQKGDECMALDGGKHWHRIAEDCYGVIIPLHTQFRFRRRITQPKEGGESCHPEATLEIDPAGSNAPVTSEPEAGANGPSTLQEMLEGLYQAATYHRKFDSANSAGILDASLKLAERFRVKPEPRKEGDALSSVNAPVAVDTTQSEHHVLEAEPNAAPKVPPSGAAESEEKVREWWVYFTPEDMPIVFDTPNYKPDLRAWEQVRVHDATACDKRREAMENELRYANSCATVAEKGNAKLFEENYSLRSEVKRLKWFIETCVDNGRKIRTKLMLPLGTGPDIVYSTFCETVKKRDLLKTQLAEMSAMLDAEKKEKLGILQQVDVARTLLERRKS